MAYSKCAKCNGSYFEVVEQEPSKSRFKLLFVQCSSCGAVCGTMDYFNIGTQNEKIEKRISALESTISNIDSNIVKIAKFLFHK